ncbi:hypothetical protein [Nitrosomonas communis]|uniref:hypothetical protein n=1 Tax=Nitrosomonas communis TaxID=44574 RepID=UPI0026EF677C|nr:hypothetical protein [Nitrosomonas communis]
MAVLPGPHREFSDRMLLRNHLLHIICWLRLIQYYFVMMVITGDSSKREIRQ